MSGNILIVDAVTTNRIILKVKLASAHFSVTQAASADDALRLAARTAPDMIVASAALPGDAAARLIAAIRARPALACVPIVLLLPEDTETARVAALRACADEVIALPMDERIMLARIRSLLRQHHALEDMRLNAGAEGADGLAEARGGFAAQGRIALIAGNRAAAIALRARLGPGTGHALSILDADLPMIAQTGVRTPDIFAVLVGPAAQDAGMHAIAELRASPVTRHSRIVAVVESGAAQLMAALLDMGANDVVSDRASAAELNLRLRAELRRKQFCDHLRERIQDGLRAAVIDPLTGLHNRRFALPFLERLAAAPAGGRPFAVMVADLDHFKTINDTHGHAAGDKVLAHVAGLLQRNLREEDMIARIGGEEFLIALPDTPCDEARRTAARLCRAVREHPLTALPGTGPITVTVSIGVTLVAPRHGAPPPRIDALLEEADRALYAAKARGRDTVNYSERSAA
ncbi:diguanylate cyclase [Roseovarius spongiae]|nr:diguanylate cyclase [Roseovarius spongiae]